MNDYDLIKNKLINFHKTEDNKLFIQYLIVQKCISLLEFSQETIINGKGYFIAPQLREVFEYTVIFSGLDELMPLSEFINHVKNDKFVKRTRNKMESFALKSGKYQESIFKNFTKLIYDSLSEFTHANIDNLMRFSIELYSLKNEKEFFYEDFQILHDFVNGFFLITAFSLLKIDKKVKLVDEDKLLSLSKGLKPSHIESNDIYNRIVAIEAIRSRYINKFQDIKTTLTTKSTK